MALMPGCGPVKSGTADKTAPAKTAAAEIPTAQQVLERMVAAYHDATTYQDQGIVYLDAQIDDQKYGDANEPRPFGLSLMRPDKFHVEAFGAAVICDGKDCWSFVHSVPDQIVQLPAPTELTLDTAFADPLLKYIRTLSDVGDLPQLVLLTAKDPLKILLKQCETPTLLEPEKVHDALCHRVLLKRPDGEMTLWIDAQTSVLRRIDYPVDAIRQDMAQQGKVQYVRLTAEFPGAKFGATIDPGYFRLEIPAGTAVVKTFRPAHPGRLLRAKVPHFQFKDLDGKEITPDSLAGKVTVLDFWATNCEPCRKSLPVLQKYYEKYRGNSKVAFYSVSLDEKGVENDKLTAMMKELNVTIPIVRDAESQAGKSLLVRTIPTAYIIGPDGVVQDYVLDARPEVVEDFVRRVEKLLAGQNLYQDKVAEYEEWLKQVNAAKPVDQIGRLLATEQQDIPVAAKAEVAPASAPKNLKLKSLWKCDKFKDPGNVLVIQEQGKPRIFVFETWRAVAELSSVGELVATHQLEIPKSEGVVSLRTAVGKDGKRYFAATARGLQQVHLFDEKWQTVVDFPQDALESRHAGIGEAVLDDLDGDGKLKLYVGYLGVVGVHGVSLDGKRLWSNRSLTHVLGLGIYVDPSGQRSLLCTSEGNLALLDGKGEKRDQIFVGRRELHGVAVANLENKGPPKICVLAAADFGVYSLLGIDRQKGEIWSYDLPKGVSQRPIEPIVAGRVLATGPGQWLAPAADGSIHILNADGKPLDSFHYGSALSGLATAEIDGHPALIISSTNGVEAIQVSQ